MLKNMTCWPPFAAKEQGIGVLRFNGVPSADNGGAFYQSNRARQSAPLSPSSFVTYKLRRTK